MTVNESRRNIYFNHHLQKVLDWISAHSAVHLDFRQIAELRTKLCDLLVQFRRESTTTDTQDLYRHAAATLLGIKPASVTDEQRRTFKEAVYWVVLNQDFSGTGIDKPLIQQVQSAPESNQEPKTMTERPPTSNFVPMKPKVTYFEILNLLYSSPMQEIGLLGSLRKEFPEAHIYTDHLPNMQLRNQAKATQSFVQINVADMDPEAAFAHIKTAITIRLAKQEGRMVLPRTDKPMPEPLFETHNIQTRMPLAGAQAAVEATLRIIFNLLQKPNPSRETVSIALDLLSNAERDYHYVNKDLVAAVSDSYGQAREVALQIIRRELADARWVAQRTAAAVNPSFRQDTYPKVHTNTPGSDQVATRVPAPARPDESGSQRSESAQVARHQDSVTVTVDGPTEQIKLVTAELVADITTLVLSRDVLMAGMEGLSRDVKLSVAIAGKLSKAVSRLATVIQNDVLTGKCPTVPFAQPELTPSMMGTPTEWAAHLAEQIGRYVQWNLQKKTGFTVPEHRTLVGRELETLLSVQLSHVFNSGMTSARNAASFAAKAEIERSKQEAAKSYGGWKANEVPAAVVHTVGVLESVIDRLEELEVGKSERNDLLVVTQDLTDCLKQLTGPVTITPLKDVPSAIGLFTQADMAIIINEAVEIDNKFRALLGHAQITSLQRMEGPLPASSRFWMDELVKIYSRNPEILADKKVENLTTHLDCPNGCGKLVAGKAQHAYCPVCSAVQSLSIRIGNWVMPESDQKMLERIFVAQHDYKVRNGMIGPEFTGEGADPEPAAK